MRRQKRTEQNRTEERVSEFMEEEKRVRIYSFISIYSSILFRLSEFMEEEKIRVRIYGGREDKRR